MNIMYYVATLVPLAILDVIWLFSMGGHYKSWLGHLFAPTVNFVPAVIFYLIYTAGITFFVVAPAIKSGHSFWVIFATGALFGLVAYATYDLTNHATLKDWPLIVTIIDMAWGAFLTGTGAVVSVFIINYFK